MLSLLYLFMYVLFIIPSAYIFDAKGLKFGTILAALLDALGCWIRYFGKVRGRKFF